MEDHVLLMIKAEFFIQLIGASFFLILNIYLAKQGLSDPEIANYISYRFLAVMLLAFPLGFYIKRKPLKPFFITGSLGVPLVAILLVAAVENTWHQYLPLLFAGIATSTQSNGESESQNAITGMLTLDASFTAWESVRGSVTIKSLGSLKFCVI